KASRNFQAARVLQAIAGPAGGLVLSPISPAYLNAVMGSGFSAVPDADIHQYIFSSQFHFGASELSASIGGALARGRSVYHLDPGDLTLESLERKVKAPYPYHWRRVDEV